MFELVNPSHPDKIADRIAGAIVDLAYRKQKNPKVACEVLIGHGVCHIINETSCHHTKKEIKSIVYRIVGSKVKVDYKEVAQDVNLAKNQSKEIRCGDNGIFKGLPATKEMKRLSKIAKSIYLTYGTDGKYIIDGDELIICQSNAVKNELLASYPNANINPLGYWTGGIEVDSGATNRKLGSDMGEAVTGGGLCLSGDTEFLSTDYKWHRIDEWKGEEVAQWNLGALEFVKPSAYIHNEKEKLYHIYNKSKLSMCLTPNHEMLLLTSKCNLIKKQVKDVVPKLIKGCGNAGKVIHTFELSKTGKTDLSRNEVALQVAFCADGTILGETNKKWRGRIRVKKQYKKDRLRELLKGKEYKETQDGEFSIFWYKPLFENRSLYECFKDYDINTWYNIYLDIFLWDGDKERKLFRTSKKEDADFIQLLITSFGKCATISYSPAKNCYTIHELASTTTGLRKSKATPICVEEKEGDSYCFNVPSHNLIVRHNNKIFITGNCGKDLSKADVSINIYAHLLAEKLQKPVYIKCAIGDKTVKVNGKPVAYSDIVKRTREYIKAKGGFEKFAEWGLNN